MSKIRMRLQPSSPIVFSTDAAGLATRAYIADRMTPAERARQNEATSVARAQPHRQGSTDRMDESPLGRYCKRRWPVRAGVTVEDLNMGHRGDMFNAGVEYARTIHHHRVLMGLGMGSSSAAEGLSVNRTEAEVKRDLDAARMKRTDAEGVLRCLNDKALSTANRVCVDESEPFDREMDLLAHCLYALAVHFGIVKGIDRYSRA